MASLMDGADFKAKVLVPLAAAVPSVDAHRLRLAYEDCLSFARVYRQLGSRPGEPGIPYRELEALMVAGETEQAHELLLAQQARAAQLKALYDAADDFLTLFLNEARGRPLRQMTLSRFSERSPAARALAPDALRGAYCVHTYRARVMREHESPRMLGFESTADGELRLVPLSPTTARVSADDAAALAELARAQPVTPDPGLALAPPALLTALFHGMRVLDAEGNIASARLAVDALAERGGCSSATPAGVVEAIDSFASSVSGVAPVA
jgi:hypothetical protein